MLFSEAEIERLARETIARHGPRAARVAAERLNEMIDRNNIPARDVWACVVHRIHERQGSGPSWQEGSGGGVHETISRLDGAPLAAF